MAETDDKTQDMKGDKPDDLAADAQSPAGLTNKEVEDSNLLTPKSHMEFIEASNKRVEEDRKRAEEAQRAQAKAILKDDDKAKADDANAKAKPATQGDQA